jgi:ATP phosphoribosyltransferase
VEVSIALEVADVIADVVQTGRTLMDAGLKIVGAPLLESEAIVITNHRKAALSEPFKVCIERLRGVVVARDYVMVEYDAPKEGLEDFCALTPGIESPTIAPLSKQGWVAVKAMTKRKSVNDVMDRLSVLGAKGIIVTNIQACRL